MDSDNKPTETVPTDEKKQGKKRNYRKDKPWDDGTVNKWEIEVGMCVGLESTLGMERGIYALFSAGGKLVRHHVPPLQGAISP